MMGLKEKVCVSGGLVVSEMSPALSEGIRLGRWGTRCTSSSPRWI